MINTADLVERFGYDEICQLSDKQHYQTINEAVVKHAINDALGVVESYLNVLGLVRRDEDGVLLYIKADTPPKALIIKACDIARYYLHEEQATSIVKQRYDEAIDWLKLVMKNPAMLTGSVDMPSNSGIVVMANKQPDYWKN
ncbi:MAG: phage protein Gp36 family protein [Moraxella sp.]